MPSHPRADKKFLISHAPEFALHVHCPSMPDLMVNFHNLHPAPYLTEVMSDNLSTLFIVSLKCICTFYWIVNGLQPLTKQMDL